LVPAQAGGGKRGLFDLAPLFCGERSKFATANFG
jgi:hypothetical protein